MDRKHDIMRDHWEISLSPAEFDAVRSNPELPALVALARGVNALRFCHIAAVAVHDAPESAGVTRQRINSFLFNAAILFEAFETAKKLGPSMTALTSFQSQLAPLFRDPRTRTLLRKDVEWLRNKAVFHFDVKVAKEAVEAVQLPVYRFAAGRTRQTGEVYYELADNLYVNGYLDRANSSVPELDRLKALLTDITSLTVDFTDAADQVIADGLKSMGWQGKPRSNSA